LKGLTDYKTTFSSNLQIYPYNLVTFNLKNKGDIFKTEKHSLCVAVSFKILTIDKFILGSHTL